MGAVVLRHNFFFLNIDANKFAELSAGVGLRLLVDAGAEGIDALLSQNGAGGFRGVVLALANKPQLFMRGLSDLLSVLQILLVCLG